MRLKPSARILGVADLAYLGGLFDGEGSAGVYVINRRHYGDGRDGESYRTIHPVMQVRMTDPEPIDFLHEAFGGWRGQSRAATERHRGPIHEWRVSHRSALRTANALLPHLRNKSKIQQVALIVSHYENWTPARRGEHRYPVAA